MINYIAIDLQQVFYHVKRQKRRLDFKKLYETLKAETPKASIFAYLTTSPHTESSYLINTLKDIGFNIQTQEQKKERKQLKFSTRSVGITIDILEQLDQINEVVLVTIDPNLTALCEYLQDMDKKVTVWTFKKFEEDFQDSVDHLKFITEDLFVKTKG